MQINMKNLKLTTEQELTQYAIDKLKDCVSPDRVYGCDLHNELFNQDYFIIGYYAAEQWLIANGGIFNAIDEIKEYEEDNFGKGYVGTDLSSSEKVCNMYVYIKGEEILGNSKVLQDNWDNRLSKEDINAIIEELTANASL